jgi:hypothetical protein
MSQRIVVERLAIWIGRCFQGRVVSILLHLFNVPITLAFTAYAARKRHSRPLGPMWEIAAVLGRGRTLGSAFAAALSPLASSG